MSAVIDPSQSAPAPQPICESEQRELLAGAPRRILAFGPDGRVDRAGFEADVRALAATLPQARHAVNLCEDRYRFLVALCAVA
ncbi:hypothetical protein JTP77_044725, partial [Streptomyces sp. S9]|nr:hypothetical protein [Streptomyces sp. S9]